MTDGEDIRQLERNLRALGHDPGTVDDDWDSDTTAAVKRFQEARELDEDGTLSRGEIVFRPGPIRIGEAKAAVGDQASPGRPLAEISSNERRVTVALDARRQQLARRGDRVTVELPSGRTVDGRIEDVGKVATKQGDEVVVEVTITLSGRSGEPRSGAGRRRVRGRAPQGRAGGAGEGAARAPGRRLRARADRRAAA